MNGSQPPRGERRALQGTCLRCPGARGFTNLLVRRAGDGIVLDPHAVGCVIQLDEAEAAALRDLLVEWLGGT